MKAKTAGLILLGICAILAVLLITGVIGFIAAGIVFAAALAGFGLASRGFRNR